ncbi:DNA-methyltransferase [Paenibacillus oryzisoli]|uniref:DNA-methyltransferase n=1 Tax=Paenibacillus oryzisoli TaxID=1850517 RepID=UPI000AD63B63|nr:site-specific DNA-methyltransferase [Paenibacillus oryzisoli]
MINEIFQGDCLDIMKDLPDKSFDMILCDLPYGSTQNQWDSPIPLDQLWQQYERLIKDRGVIVLTAQTPFDKVLGNSNLQMLRYEWIWVKNRPTGFFNAKKMPMKTHENILIFYKNLPQYNPQKTLGHKPVNRFKKHSTDGSNYNDALMGFEGGGQTDRYPVDVLYFPRDKDRYHPTQKPVALFEYLIKTYTNEGDLVLDNCLGSGTTALAAASLNRNFTGIELDANYVQIARDRLKRMEQQMIV